MKWLLLGLFVAAVLTLCWILRTRRSSITGERSRNKHFLLLSRQLGFEAISNDYFLQLEGSVGGARAIIYPHHFEGPGLITLFYFETAVPATNRNWIEPNLSLGRALVAWKQKTPVDFEISGTELSDPQIRNELNSLKQNYPYLAVTLPHRFSYSPLLQKSMESWKNYVIFLVLDDGRRPGKSKIEMALRDANLLAAVVNQRTTFSETTG